MDSWKRFHESVPLDQKYYYSRLNDENVSDSVMDHVKNVCNTFKIKNLGKYHDLYVITDTVLLADVFENFRDKCLNTYKLDPVYYLSVPGFSWQSCLKMTKIKLELLIDNDILLLFEKGIIRGGMCNAIHTYANANNKYMKNYDSTKESIYIMYLDANNLYGWAMSKKLPIDNFKWETDLSKFTSDFIKNYDEESDIGYLLFIDAIYPKNLYEEHSDLPFLPIKTDKLYSNLRDKKYYSINIFALKQAMNHGIEFEKVHKVITFRQGAWLKPHIDLNTELRIKSANDFEKDFYKLCINSAFGKTMENVRKHRDIKLVTNDQKRGILASEPNYHSTEYVSDDLLIMEMKKREVYMNKPIYLGQAILDLSKMLMYEFWYDYLKPKYAKNIKLCYTNTDSFIFLVKTNDFYKDISDDIEKWFDTSAYSKDIDRPLLKGINKKVIGKFKDELAGQIISELCILRAECSSFKLDNDNEEIKAKGIKECVIKHQLTFDNYVDALFNDNKINRSQYVFRSYCHQVYTEKVTKIALSGNNDQRIQTTDKITTYPYGYFDKDNNNSTHVNINNDDGFDKLIERVKTLNKRLDTRLNNIDILNEKSKEYREKIDKRVSNDNKVHIVL